MHANELPGPVLPGQRPPDIDPALADTRVKPEFRPGRSAGGKSRRPAARAPTPRPVRYGAGF